MHFLTTHCHPFATYDQIAISYCVAILLQYFEDMNSIIFIALNYNYNP